MEAFSLKDFKVLKTLGQGSYSTVNLVKKISTNQFYALKIVKLDKLTHQDKDAALNQVRILASISSHHIISYEGSFYSRQTNSLCILMEFANNGDLQTIINKCAEEHQMSQGLPEKFIWRALLNICQGLQILHENNIVHRDLKSANIFYSDDGHAKIGDFNVSKISDNQMYSTKTGTPYYTAPEIWKGQLYNSKCDIWSLGCILYEMCVLLPPFRSSNFPQLFIMISKGYYDAIPTTYSQQLRLIIQMCLQVNPQDRLSAAELLNRPELLKFTAEMKQKNRLETTVDLIGPLKCPKILKNMNFSLPKPIKSRKQLFEGDKPKINKKKTVDFGNLNSQKEEDFKANSRKTFAATSIRIRKQNSRHKGANIPNPVSFTNIRSQKQIKSQYSIYELPQLNKKPKFSDKSDKIEKPNKANKNSSLRCKFRLQSAAKGKPLAEKQNHDF